MYHKTKQWTWSSTLEICQRTKQSPAIQWCVLSYLFIPFVAPLHFWIKPSDLFSFQHLLDLSGFDMDVLSLSHGWPFPLLTERKVESCFVCWDVFSNSICSVSKRELEEQQKRTVTETWHVLFLDFLWSALCTKLLYLQSMHHYYLIKIFFFWRAIHLITIEHSLWTQLIWFFIFLSFLLQKYASDLS